ncbi:MAG: 2-amino-4-hydroxy-6-hydroxymethyldihydropteridine diphosphokinase [Gammaproteobacteria bacterium]|jgi:2-amino-4-hydroxy-6-hydroxymethyldihydropteridine diphosphokinase|tara:strand:+ start:2491 stop:2868 length:378 start_codon:yes stop_codon:yes gene_type:complete
MKYFLSLGSNINASDNIKFAIKELSNLLFDPEISSAYQTTAEGFEGDDFLNLVVAGSSEMNFTILNQQLKEIENSAGRDRNAPKFSARTLDIDIILQINDADEIIFESEEIQKYQFVSEPLQELI